MGRTTWSGPIRTGTDTGAAATRTIGSVVLNQATTVTRTNSAAAQVAKLPENSDVLDIKINVTQSFQTSGATGVCDIRVGTTAVDDRFGSFRVSAAGLYSLAARTSVTQSWENLTAGNTTIVAQVTAVGSATAASPGEAVVRVIYAQRA